jgi:hypothetical protein
MADTTTGDYNDGGLEAASELAANKAYADAVTRLNGQRLNTLQGAGYMGDIDAKTGTVGNLRVDPNNPYGDYQSLLRTGARQSEATHDQLAGRGIGGGSRSTPSRTTSTRSAPAATSSARPSSSRSAGTTRRSSARARTATRTS